MWLVRQVLTLAYLQQAWVGLQQQVQHLLLQHAQARQLLLLWPQLLHQLWRLLWPQLDLLQIQRLRLVPALKWLQQAQQVPCLVPYQRRLQPQVLLVLLVSASLALHWQ